MKRTELQEKGWKNRFHRSGEKRKREMWLYTTTKKKGEREIQFEGRVLSKDRLVTGVAVKICCP